MYRGPPIVWSLASNSRLEGAGLQTGWTAPSLKLQGTHSSFFILPGDTMNFFYRWSSFLLAALLVAFPATLLASGMELRNDSAVAQFGPSGLISFEDASSHERVDVAGDAWSMVVDNTTLRSADASPEVNKTDDNRITYTYQFKGYRVQVEYWLKPDSGFVSKRIEILEAPGKSFVVHKVVPWDLSTRTPVIGDFVPSTYVPQVGSTIEKSRQFLPGRDFGEFLRFANRGGALLTVQNPFLDVQRQGQSVSIAYSPEMEWQQNWGKFESDIACIGAYRLSGERLPREMVLEWHIPPAQMPQDGMDRAEIDAFTRCVRAFLIHPSPEPITVEVGWTLNDYQIDVGTEGGRSEYKRVIDVASDLGIHTLLYGPGNSLVSSRSENTDSWGWEYVLWLGLGQKIRKGQWDPERDDLPETVSQMIDYARSKQIGLLAYVYPSIPFAKDPAWIVQGESRGSGFSGDPGRSYATLSSREFQDYLIRKLVAFQKRTGIAGYSFDYTWMTLPGSSSYSQWYGWRRVMETLRREIPSIVIDGRQSYQMYGPWTWLAGSYPHPTGTDEQPESFKPFPDLHFDRVSADRARYVNFWYRNYQFAPEQIIPGYATHQTERSRNLPGADGKPGKVEMMYTRFRPRDWDYLGFRYSFISSIATAGWNNVVDMIPGRDPEEAAHFSPEDKGWIREWLKWTVKNRAYLQHTRTILGQPALTHADGTTAIIGDRGFVFLFNPNYKQVSARFTLDKTIGLSAGETFLLRELYPQKGRLIGKPGAGLWKRGDIFELPLDGTSATVLEIVPATEMSQPLVFNAAAIDASEQPSVTISGTTVAVTHAAGEPGRAAEIGVLLPRDLRVSSFRINGTSQPFAQHGRYVEAKVRFQGAPFAQAQQISVHIDAEGAMTGSFVVPQRVFAQLAARERQWPIPWTPDDYQTTWLVPSRLLLFVQFADGTDAMNPSIQIDGKPIALKAAYSSVREHAASFVGFYADLSSTAPGVRHTIQVKMPQAARAKLQGIFFDNVEPQFSETLAQ